MPDPDDFETEFKKFDEKTKDVFAEFDKRAGAFDKRVDSTYAASRENMQARQGAFNAKVEKEMVEGQRKTAADRANLEATYNAAKGPEFTTEKGTVYKVTENGIMRRQGVASSKGLEPKVYKVKDNGSGKTVYACGPVRSSIYNATTMAAQVQLSEVVVEHDIYNDMKKRGDNSVGAQAFMAKHEKDLDAWGLVKSGKGLVQTNPKGRAALAYTEVKDLKALDKQVEKDKKESAAFVAQRQQAMQAKR